MFPVILKHLKSSELPADWAKQLSTPSQTFTVVILPEDVDAPFTSSSRAEEVAYLHYLRACGMDLERLEESIRQLEAGQVETVDVNNLDTFLDEFIQADAFIEPHTECQARVGQLETNRPQKIQ